MIAIVLRNDEEAVFSASSATEGGHGALAHVPGSALWGAVCASVYGHAGKDTFDLLHSGKLRVSPGFPLTATRAPAFPLPQTFQGPKHADKGLQRAAGDSERYATLSPSMRNTLRREDGDAEALDVPKGWYLAADGSMVKPEARERGKAATEPGDRRVASGQFFQYEHLRPQQQWLAWIDADDRGLEEEIVDGLTAAPLVLGRSKRREFGGAFRVTRVDHWTDPRSAQLGGDAEGELILWCLSDVALVDELGAPNLAPEPQHFGIAGFAGALDMPRSAINVRRYAPYNTYLKANDREHCVIAAGSVLVYKGVTRISRAVLRGGIGLWRERGLGIVWPDAPILRTGRPSEVVSGVEASGRIAERPMRSGNGQAKSMSESEQSLLAGLREYAQDRRDQKSVAETANEIKTRLLRQLKGAATRGDPTPGPSQWLQVADKAKASRTIADLWTALLHESDNAQERGCCVGPTNRDWDGIRSGLRQIIEAQRHLDEDSSQGHRRVFLRAFARAARSVAREWISKGGRT